MMNWQELEPIRTGEKVIPCEQHADDTLSLWGEVRRGNEAIAAYFARYTVDCPEFGASFDFIIGAWGEGTSPDDRSAVSADYQIHDGNGAFMVVDAEGRRDFSSLASTMCRRDDVIGKDLARTVFALLDAVFMKEPGLQPVRSWAH
ncbi:MAG: hypothetical protein AAGH41_02545 [Pseudomonadota bacterium]